MSWITDLFKTAGQRQLDAYKPTAIRTVRDIAARYGSQALTADLAAKLQTDIILAVTKSELNPSIKSAISLAVLYGVTEAHLSMVSQAVAPKMEMLVDLIVGKIQGARL